MHDAFTGRHDVAIVMLAGGEARRFPKKLEQPIGGQPIVLRCYRALRATGWPVYLSGKGSFSDELDAQLDAPLIRDRRPGGGPLQAFAGVCDVIDAEKVFAIAADQPQMQPELLMLLWEACREGDEAVVPTHDGRIEPLAALYLREAVVREYNRLQRDGKSAMRDLLDCLAARYVRADGEYFYNVNEPDDLVVTKPT
jgi:molybdopterin-guanine dinucleotide biosynthesis protein A